MPRCSLGLLLLLVTALLPSAGQAQEAPAKPSLAAEPAAPGTPEGAASLREALTAYLTGTPFENGSISIEADTAGQRIRLDPADALAGLTGRPVRFEPISFVVSEREDGTWNVFSDDPLDAKAAFEVEGQQQEEEYKQDWQLFKGIFSPELGAFLTAEVHSGPTKQVSRDDVSSVVLDIAGTSAEMSAAPAEGGGADIAFRQTYDGYAQTFALEIPLEEGEEPFGFTFDAKIADLEASGSVDGTRTRALLDLYALAIKHAEEFVKDPEAAFAGQPGQEILQAFREALPVWGKMDVTAIARDFTLSTIYGDLAVEESSQAVRMSGIASEAFFETDLKLSGIDLEAALLPDWAGSFVPRSVAMTLATSGVDLASPLDIALREVDFASDPPLSDEAVAEIGEAFGRDDIRARIENGRVVTETFDLAFEGSMSFAESAPAARLSLDMDGLDETIAVLQEAAATEPDLHQAVGMLQIAKGFGKAEGNGRTQWVVETAGDGSVTVNGTMLKGPDTAEPEPSREEL